MAAAQRTGQQHQAFRFVMTLRSPSPNAAVAYEGAQATNIAQAA